MTELSKLPNIGTVLSNKLKEAGISNKLTLTELGSENAIVRLTTIDNSGVCLNMLYALEGAIQGIRWHNLNKERKDELKDFFQSMNI